MVPLSRNLRAGDILAMAKMVGEGRGVVLKQGQRVQLQDAAIFGGEVKVRPIGETKSWWTDSSHSSTAPVMTDEEKPKEEHYDAPATQAQDLREMMTDIFAKHMVKQIAKDPDAAAKQTQGVISYAKELEKYGEVTELQYLEGAKIWAEMGFSPREIAELISDAKT